MSASRYRLLFRLDVDDPGHIEQSRVIMRRVGAELDQVFDRKSGQYLTRDQVAEHVAATPEAPSSSKPEAGNPEKMNF